jgi:hypothetical protein
VSLLALQQDFEAWLTREPAELPETLLDSHRPGLAVYLNNYRAQLLACLGSSFPVVRSLIGESAFDAAAAKFIEDHPPHSWTLDAYANGFPASLAALFADEPQIGELAQLELALGIAFVGPDAEPLEASQIAGMDWDAAIIHLAPTFTLLPVTTNVGAIWSAISAGNAPPPAESAAGESLAVWRTRFAPQFRTALVEERAMLGRVREGTPFGRICSELVAELGEERGVAAAGAALGQWLSDGVIVEGKSAFSPA